MKLITSVTKKSKAFITILLAIALSLTIVAPATASTQTPSAWAISGVNEARQKGFVPDGFTQYQAATTRQQFAQLSVSWLEYILGQGIERILSERAVRDFPRFRFEDTADRSVEAAYRLGVINGTRTPTNTSAGTFSPNNSITRQEAAVMVRNVILVAMPNLNPEVEAYWFTDRAESASWAHQGIDFVRAYGIMSGTSSGPQYWDMDRLVFGRFATLYVGTFSPRSSYTIEQSIVTFNRIEYIEVGFIGHQGEREAFELINAFRRENGEPEGVWNDALGRAARAHSRDKTYNPNVTEDRGAILAAHIGSDGSDVTERAWREGYRGIVGENFNSGTFATDSFNNFLRSPPHRNNMLGGRTLSGEPQDIGIGFYGYHWTQKFGSAIPDSFGGTPSQFPANPQIGDIVEIPGYGGVNIRMRWNGEAWEGIPDIP